MHGIKLTLLILSISTYLLFSEALTEQQYLSALESEAEETGNAFAAPELDQDAIGEQEEEHERVKRSPWGRIRIRVRRFVRKVAAVVKKIPKEIHRVAKKIPKELNRVGKQIGSEVRRNVRKVGHALKKTVREIKRTVRQVKELPRKAEKAVRKIRDKVKDKVAGLIMKRETEEEVEEEIPIPDVVDETAQPTPAKPTVPACDDECQTINKYKKDADFFKQGFCAFYTTKRNQRDFLLDRNKNKTLEKWIGSVTEESLSLYLAYVDALKMLKSDIILETKEQATQNCIHKARQQCSKKTAEDVLKFHLIKCFKPCSGFTGCVQEDKNLGKLLDDGIRAHDQKLNSAS